MIRVQAIEFFDGKRVGGDVLYINPAHLVRFARSKRPGSGAIMVLTDGSLWEVVESPEAIRTMITARGL